MIFFLKLILQLIELMGITQKETISLRKNSHVPLQKPSRYPDYIKMSNFTCARTVAIRNLLQGCTEIFMFCQDMHDINELAVASTKN